MDMFKTIFLLFWGGIMVFDTLEFCALWQLKEYRFDRLRDFFTSNEGRRFVLRYQFFWRTVLAIIVLFWPFHDTETLRIFFIGLVAADLMRIGFSRAQKSVRRPVFTGKAVLLIVAAGATEVGAIAAVSDWGALPAFLIFRFFLFSVWVEIFRIPTFFLKRRIIRRAEAKLRAFPRLLVIGVTGSYGKTSVKNALHHVLSGSFKTIATPDHVNTDIGVAQYILRTDFSDSDAFIVEMGAYRRGEIQAICDLVHPTIGVLTAISPQHLSLFGSMQNIQSAKYELLRSLPSDGLAVVNGENSYCTEPAATLKARVVFFSPGADIRSATVAPCRIIAEYLGMSRETTERQIAILPAVSFSTLAYGQATIIDDSYNSNPDGFLAALRFLDEYAGNRPRVVVTRGMIELGEKSDELHRMIGTEISKRADRVILVNRDAEKIFTETLSGSKTALHVCRNTKELLSALRAWKQTPAVILIENRVPKLVKQEFAL